MIDRELRTHHQNCPTEIVPIIADIQDREKINEIMEQYHPDIVYHAAAHKHVPLMEYNPKEAVKTIFSVQNVAEAAKAAKVKTSSWYRQIKLTILQMCHGFNKTNR